jgi:hypothetical protein
MASSKAKTVSQYLESLPKEKRDAIETVRGLILKHLPEGIVETMDWGMICYVVPLEIEPDTYNGRPLVYAALASQKHYNAVYLSCVYCDPKRLERFRSAFQKAGKKLDMGKSCVRFKKADDLCLPAIADVIAGTSMKSFVKMSKRARQR